MEHDDAPPTPSRKNRRPGAEGEFLGASKTKGEGGIHLGQSFLDEALNGGSNIQDSLKKPAENIPFQRPHDNTIMERSQERRVHDSNLCAVGGSMHVSRPPMHAVSRRPHRTLSLACAGDHGDADNVATTELSAPVKSVLYARRQMTHSGHNRLVGLKCPITSSFAGGGTSSPGGSSTSLGSDLPPKRQRVVSPGSRTDCMVDFGGVDPDLFDHSEVDESLGLTPTLFWSASEWRATQAAACGGGHDERRLTEYLSSIPQGSSAALDAVIGLLDLDDLLFAIVSSCHVPAALSAFLEDTRVLLALAEVMLGSQGAEGQGYAGERDADVSLRRAALACEILCGKHSVGGVCMRAIADSESHLAVVFDWLLALEACEGASVPGGEDVTQAHKQQAQTRNAHMDAGTPSSISTSTSACAHAQAQGSSSNNNSSSSNNTCKSASQLHTCTRNGVPLEAHAQFFSRFVRAMVGANGHVHAGDAARVKLLAHVHTRLAQIMRAFCATLWMPCIQEAFLMIISSDERGWSFWVDSGLMERLLAVVGSCDMTRPCIGELAASTLVGLAELTSGGSRGICSLPFDRRLQSESWLASLFNICARVVPRGEYAPLLILDVLLTNEDMDPYLDPDEPPPLLSLLRSEGVSTLIPPSLTRHPMCALHLIKIYNKVRHLSCTHPAGPFLHTLVVRMAVSTLTILLAPKACSILLLRASNFLKDVVGTMPGEGVVQLCTAERFLDVIAQALLSTVRGVKLSDGRGGDGRMSDGRMCMNSSSNGNDDNNTSNVENATSSASSLTDPRTYADTNTNATSSSSHTHTTNELTSTHIPSNSRSESEGGEGWSIERMWVCDGEVARECVLHLREVAAAIQARAEGKMRQAELEDENGVNNARGVCNDAAQRQVAEVIAQNRSWSELCGSTSI